jgi:hypothetical protein
MDRFGGESLQLTHASSRWLRIDGGDFNHRATVLEKVANGF